jgi:hypothetical protein
MFVSQIESDHGIGMIQRLSAAVFSLLCAWAISAATTPETHAKVDFNAEIRPLLSDRCYKCHGPDEKSRKAKLRLDTQQGALGKTKNGVVISPGKPSQSELYQRITSTDPDFKMPPPESNLTLKQDEIDLLKRWIAQGAEWEKHWAFVPPKRVEPPSVKNAAWPKNEIDHFILARLEKQGLSPAPETTREKWLRRVTFDLTGLPPTLKEIDAFLADHSDRAYETVVDRLLASPEYGERMTTDWLDLARYSDTHGYQADRYRAMWPWRDWVLKAFNENMPYDQFATWQVAGDLLPHPTKEQILATGFNRLHMQTEEGGSVAEEFRVAYVVDRVDTFGTAFLALTLECSRCHDHKFDPLKQQEFYQMFSFFNNIDESGQDSYFTDSMPVPTMLLSSDEQDQRLNSLNERIAKKENQIGPLRESARGAFDEWMRHRPATPEIKGLEAAYSFDEVKENKSPNSVDPGKPAHAVENPKLVEDGHSGKAILLSGENGFTLNGVGVFSRTDPFTISVWIKAPNVAKRAVIFHRSMAALDAGSRGYEMVLEEGHVSLGLHHMWPGNAMKVRSKSVLKTNEWTHLVMTYDGSSRAAGLKLFWNGQPAEMEVIRDHLWKDITYERGDPQLTIGYRFRDNGFRDGMIDDFKVYHRVLTPLEIRQIHGDDALENTLAEASPSPEIKERLFDYYLANYNPIYRKYLADLRAVRTEQSHLINPIAEVMVMRELPKPRPAYILKRGAYDAPGEEVAMGTPAAVAPFKPEYPKNRLGLAQWLFEPENPLTARVEVNRLWQMMFGKGIVATSDNFGSQGDLPTHPKLLDWLANDFRDHGWNIKRMLREMALSATYRQSSVPSSEAEEKDPENKLLARAPSYRLSAEMLRDNALATSGLLVKKLGGPPVKPYQPEGLWEEKSGAHYERDKGDGLYRRSLYTFWKRTSPPPAMVAFDAAERNTCIVHRQVTSTPLQSLVLLNDPQITEASRFIAERMMKEGGSTPEDRLTFAFRLLTSRKPKSSELSILERLYEEQKSLFQRNQRETLKLLLVGDKANDPALDPIELAANSVVASALLNFDETIIKR